MATHIGYRPIRGDYSAGLPDLDGEAGITTEPGHTVTVGTYYFVSESWYTPAVKAVFMESIPLPSVSRRGVVVVQFDDADIVETFTTDKQSLKSYDRDLAQFVSDNLNTWNINNGDIIDEFTDAEVSQLNTRTNVASIFSSHGLDPGSPY